MDIGFTHYTTLPYVFSLLLNCNRLLHDCLISVGMRVPHVGPSDSKSPVARSSKRQQSIYSQETKCLFEHRKYDVISQSSESVA